MLTGSGHAGKEQMQMAVQRELRLKTRPEPADAADALAIALADFYLRFRALPGAKTRFKTIPKCIASDICRSQSALVSLNVDLLFEERKK